MNYDPALVTKQLEKRFCQLVSKTALIRKGDLFKIAGVKKEEKAEKPRRSEALLQVACWPVGSRNQSRETQLDLWRAFPRVSLAPAGSSLAEGAPIYVVELID